GQPRRHQIEPDELALGVENHDPVRQRGRGVLQLAHELHEALLVEAFAPVQAHDLGNDLAPHAADIGRVRVAAVAQPPLQAEKVGELPAEVQSERAAEPAPGAAEQPAGTEADQHRAEQSARREPPCLRRGLHASVSPYDSREPLDRARGEAVPGATHGLNESIVPELLERLAQAADVHVDGTLLDVDVSAPDAVEELIA